MKDKSKKRVREQQEHFLDFEGMPSGMLIPRVNANVLVASCKAGPNKSGNLMVTVQYRITAPAEVKNMSYYERYTLGSNEDPDAMDPKGKTIGQILWTRALKAAAIQLSNQTSVEKACEVFEGKQLGLTITEQLNKTTGEPENRIGTYFQIGDREPQLLDTPESAPKPLRPKPKPEPEPEDDEDESDEEEDEDEDDEDEDEEGEDESPRKRVRR